MGARKIMSEKGESTDWLAAENPVIQMCVCKQGSAQFSREVLTHLLLLSWRSAVYG